MIFGEICFQREKERKNLKSKSEYDILRHLKLSESNQSFSWICSSIPADDLNVTSCEWWKDSSSLEIGFDMNSWSKLYALFCILFIVNKWIPSTPYHNIHHTAQEETMKTHSQALTTAQIPRANTCSFSLGFNYASSVEKTLISLHNISLKTNHHHRLACWRRGKSRGVGVLDGGRTLRKTTLK